jgi:hypothetical protein
MFAKNSSAECVAGGKVVITPGEDSHNHIQPFQNEYSLLSIADCGSRFD